MSNGLFGHIKLFKVNGTTDPTLQDIEITPAPGQEQVITRGYADWIDDLGPIPITVSAKVQYPRTGAPVDYWTLHVQRAPVECYFVDFDNKKGRLVNGRVSKAPRVDPIKGGRAQSVEIVGFLEEV